MTNVVTDGRCVVMSGDLVDPYTGAQIRYVRGQTTAPTIEHVRALRSAWDQGAAAWPAQRRVDFANDHALNLLLVAGPVNSSKADRGPGQWLPPAEDARCSYAIRYLQVSIKWQVPITPPDHARITALTPACATNPWPTWPAVKGSSAQLAPLEGERR